MTIAIIILFIVLALVSLSIQGRGQRNVHNDEAQYLHQEHSEKELQYLYQEHSEEELREWGTRLSMFRYCRAYRRDDGDSLDLALGYKSNDELVVLLKKIDIEPVIYEEKPDQPAERKSYSGEEYSSFPSLIKGTEWIKQPGHCEIFGVRVFVRCGDGLITIIANPWSYAVTNKYVKAAEELERNLQSLQGVVVDPPKDIKHYVCPKYHPQLFN